MTEEAVPGLGPRGHCPKCGSDNVASVSYDDDVRMQVYNVFTCRVCDHAWLVRVDFPEDDPARRMVRVAGRTLQ
jgi:formate dehydrogenase maturation protein FdhE